jgi:hypothetical protein
MRQKDHLSYSSPYVKEEDGISENTVNVMTNMMTSMLLWANLLKVFWDYAKKLKIG